MELPVYSVSTPFSIAVVTLDEHSALLVFQYPIEIFNIIDRNFINEADDKPFFHAGFFPFTAFYRLHFDATFHQEPGQLAIWYVFKNRTFYRKPHLSPFHSFRALAILKACFYGMPFSVAQENNLYL